jgi:hypothetical protein
MKIIGIEGMTDEQLALELNRGGRFVVYQYCISALVMTFQRPSDIYFVRGNESRIGRGLVFIGLSMLLGWWGIPWGPIHTVTSLVTNLRGGKDVTREVLATF